MEPSDQCTCLRSGSPRMPEFEQSHCVLNIGTSPSKIKTNLCKLSQVLPCCCRQRHSEFFCKTVQTSSRISYWWTGQGTVLQWTRQRSSDQRKIFLQPHFLIEISVLQSLLKFSIEQIFQTTSVQTKGCYLTPNQRYKYVQGDPRNLLIWSFRGLPSHLQAYS